MGMGSKKKIMIVFRGDGVHGGPNNSHLRIMESKLKQKYDFAPLYIPKGHLGIYNKKAINEMAEAIKKEKPDLVHFMGLELVGWYGMLACKRAKARKTLMAIHGSTSEAIEFNKNKIKKAIMEAIEFLTLKNTKNAYGVSEYVGSWKKIKKHIKNYYGCVYNQSITKEENENNFKKEFNLSESDILVVSTGRITKEKGYEILKNVIIGEKWDNNVKFVIVGDGDYLEKMKEEISYSHMKDNVVFTGFRKDIDNVLKSGDIFLICSLHETLCMSVMEACQYKLPVVATRVGGIPEIIEDGENGYLVNTYDVAGFIEDLKRLIENKELRENLGKRGEEIVKEKFNPDSIINKIDSIYEDILKEE